MHESNTIFWTAYCNKERIIAISEIESIVDKYGFITDFKEFSDLSLALQIEVEESKINNLYFALRGYMSVDDYEIINSISKLSGSFF